MALAQNVYDASVLTWSIDAVEPQLHFPAPSFTVKLAASTTYPKGAKIGEVTASPGVFGLWVHANSDGTQNWKAILPRAYVTDANGNIYEGAQASGELIGVNYATVPAFFGGCFRQTDVDTLTAQAFTDLLVSAPGAHVYRGTVAGGNALIVF